MAQWIDRASVSQSPELKVAGSFFQSHQARGYIPQEVLTVMVFAKTRHWFCRSQCDVISAIGYCTCAVRDGAVVGPGGEQHELR